MILRFCCVLYCKLRETARNRKRDGKRRWFSCWWPLLFTADCHNRACRCRAVATRQNQHGLHGGPRDPSSIAGRSKQPAELQTGAFHVAQAEALQALLSPEQSCGMAEKHTQLGNTPSWSCTTLNCLFLLSQPAERVMTTTRSDDISPAASELAHRQVSSSPCLSLTGQLEQGDPEHPMGLGWGDCGLMAHGPGWGNARCCTALARTLLEEIGVY